jgi:hypothetical protein
MAEPMWKVLRRSTLPRGNAGLLGVTELGALGMMLFLRMRSQSLDFSNFGDNANETEQA